MNNLQRMAVEQALSLLEEDPNPTKRVTRAIDWLNAALDVMGSPKKNKPSPARLPDLAATATPAEVSIMHLVADSYGISREMMRNMTRVPEAAEARGVAAYLLHSIKGKTMLRVAGVMGYADHTSVYRAIAKVERRSAKDESYKDRVRKLKACIDLVP